MNPRILILSTAFLPHIGGSELAIHHITKRLPQYDFDLITKRFGETTKAVEQIGRVRVFRVSSPKFLLPFAISFRAFRLMLSHRYELLHAYQASQAAGAAWMVHVARPSLPFLITLQEGKSLDTQSWSVRWARALMIKSADRITAISNYLAHYARRYTKVPVNIIPNGVEIHGIQNMSHNEPTILTVSRLVQKNNIEGIIRAFAIVRRTIPSARLVIAGSGPLKEKLQSVSEQQHVSVEFIGTVPHEKLSGIYAAADVFVRPSLSEGLGSVFLEAMASRVPVVASPVGGIPDIVRHEETGLLCNPDDPDDIARSIIRLLTDKKLSDRIVSTAYEMVRSTYDWDIISGQMDSVYRHMQKA